MLDKVKLALQITDNTFDSELSGLIDAAVIDLNIAGVKGTNVSTATTDAIVIRAIVSYCVYQFEMAHGNLDRANAIKVSYDEQKSQLGMATNYTEW